MLNVCFFFSSRRRHTRWPRDWSSDVCSSDGVFQRFRIVLLPDDVAERLRPPLAGYDLVAHCEVLSSKFWLSILYLQLRTLRRKTFCAERNFGSSAAPEVNPVPLLPPGPGGVRGASLHRARAASRRRSRAFPRARAKLYHPQPLRRRPAV